MKQQLKKRFKDLSTYRKLVLSFLLIAMLIVTIIGISSYRITSNRIYNQTIGQTAETVMQLSDNLSNFCDLMITRVTNVATNPVVQQELNAAATDVNIVDDDYYSRYKQIRFVLVQAFSSVYMYGMELQGDNGAHYFISVDGVQPQHEEIDRKIAEARSVEGKAIFINTISENGYIELMKEVRDNLTRKPKGIVYTSIKSSYIGDMTHSIDFGADGKVIILDAQNKEIVNADHVDLSGITGKLNGAGGKFNLQIDGKDYLIIYREESSTEWKTIALIPTTYFQNALTPLRNVVLLAIVMTVILCFVVSNLLARVIVRPIENTAKAMQKFSEGDFLVRLEVDSKDELGIMAHGFNKMVEEIESLVKQVTKAKVLEKELEFKTLQAQINPHFLYNALDTINWMARKKGYDDICQMITSLSNLMRGSISNKKSIVTLKQELKYVEDYLYIQKMRYRDRIQVVFNIDENALTQMIPKLTVQPIVENSVVHGIEESQKPCELEISVQVVEGEVEILIHDTGRGMTREILQHILEEPVNYYSQGVEIAHTGLGMYAVNKRLKYIYGEKYGMQVTSEEGIGTTTAILIPFMDDPIMIKDKYENLLGGENE